MQPSNFHSKLLTEQQNKNNNSKPTDSNMNNNDNSMHQLISKMQKKIKVMNQTTSHQLVKMDTTPQMTQLLLFHQYQFCQVRHRK